MLKVFTWHGLGRTGIAGSADCWQRYWYLCRTWAPWGYKFQFVTLAGFHSLNHGMFELSQGYSKRGMAAYAELQQVCEQHLRINGSAPWDIL